MHTVKLWYNNVFVEKLQKRILEASEAPPVSAFTLSSKKGVWAFPDILFSLQVKMLNLFWIFNEIITKYIDIIKTLVWTS